MCVFSRFFALFLVMFIIALASHAGVFRGARLSSLPTRGRGGEGSGKTPFPKNACVGVYYSFSPTRKVCDRLIFMS